MALDPPFTSNNDPTTSSPLTRNSSPSPSASPTPAIAACPPLGRSFSTASSDSTFSGHSAGSTSSSGSAPPQRRGYVRPQRASFAESAKSRDSVMSLGSIAHLQYYFARTGLLDGKGGQLAQEGKKRSATGIEPLRASMRSFSEPTACSASSYLGGEFVDSPNEEEVHCSEWDDTMMLPPTVSTYSHRVQYLPPPPDAVTLKAELRKTLLEAQNALQEVQDHNRGIFDRRTEEEGQLEGDCGDSEAGTGGQGWYGIQGVHILDVITLAIRAAKIYYTNHNHPDRLSGIKSERRIREELLGVMDVLKRMVARNFAGGIKEQELKTMADWVDSVETLLVHEEAVAKQEVQQRESWKWLEGSWTDHTRQREWLFMCSFLPGVTLPEWTPQSDAGGQPTAFLQALADGLHLVHLHNATLKKSKRQFGEITVFHTDTAKPYRRSENLRYWIKAAEIRWETKMQLNVTGIVHDKGDGGKVWNDFDKAVMQWCKVVREELTKEWKNEAGKGFI
ncbi:hypothetical protein LPUS_10625 [Lasallia pustulata]|uniref:Uncharacterized protein n=1 Tax=Lasallia pustulata TaxID=136370 RepID=A0A1W5D9W7_9LECA|nr:hypothetical protein LPUS_10625 [Lasallia pustulata]